MPFTTACFRAKVAIGLCTAWLGQCMAQEVKPFDQTLTLQGITFHVTSPNLPKGNTLKIAPKGLQLDNSPFSHDIDGLVTGAEIADINADRSPEIYVYVREQGDKAAMSLSSITLQPLTENPRAARGYGGHDDLAVVEGVLLRRFSVVDTKGGNPKSTGKTRQVQYKLKPGEAGWLLKISRIDEY